MPGCTASPSGLRHTGAWGQPPPPSPPSPRVRPPLTCFLRGSQLPLPPPPKRVLVSRGPRGGGAAHPEAAPPLQPAPISVQATPPEGTLPAGWSTPAAAPPTHLEAWPIGCAEGREGPRPAPLGGQSLGGERPTLAHVGA